MKTSRKIYLVLLIIYIITAKGYLEVSDTFYSVKTAESIIDRGKLNLNVPSSKMYTINGVNGEVYSKYGIGLAFYYIPFVYAAEVVSKFTGFSEVALVGFLISFANLPFIFIFLILFERLLLHFKVHRKYANIIILGLGIGSVFWRYALYDFSEIQQSALLLSVIYGLIINSKKALVLSGTSFALLIMLKLFSIIYLPCIFIYFSLNFIKDRDFKKCLCFAIPIITGILILLYLNFIRFGNAFESGYGSETNDFIFTQLPRTVPALLFSIDKGIIFYCPIVILAFAGWRNFFKLHFNLALMILLIISVNLVTTAAWWSWYGGWSWGPRLLIPVMALWCVPIAFWLNGKLTNIKKHVLIVVTILGFVFQIPGILVKDQEIHHIKEIIFNKEEEKFAPSDYLTTCILFYHKVRFNNEIYSGEQFGIKTKGSFNLENYETYIGFNIWTEQMARFFHLPNIRYLPFLGFILIILIIIWPLNKTKMSIFLE